MFRCFHLDNRNRRCQNLAPLKTLPLTLTVAEFGSWGGMKGMICKWRMLLFAVLASVSVDALYAQTLGEISGRVTDPSGSVIPAAAVALTNVNTNSVRNAVTTDAGVYTFPSVAPGSYQLTIRV